MLCLCIVVGFVLCNIYVFWYVLYSVIFMYFGGFVLCYVYVLW